MVREWGSGCLRLEQADKLGLKPGIVPRLEVDDGINAARAIFANCEFDEEACSEGLKALRSYRKDWDRSVASGRSKPRHDWASHGRTHLGVSDTIQADAESAAGAEWKT